MFFVHSWIGITPEDVNEVYMETSFRRVKVKRRPGKQLSEQVM